MNLANYNVGKKHELCLLIEIYFEVKKSPRSVGFFK
jgi:hypothetical protein